MNDAFKIRILDSNPRSTAYGQGIMCGLQTSKKDCFPILKMEVIILS